MLITGTAQQGQTLTANTVTNDPNATITYQWMENSGQGGAYQNISGATGATYVAQQTDVGFNIEVVATASDLFSRPERHCDECGDRSSRYPIDVTKR